MTDGVLIDDVYFWLPALMIRIVVYINCCLHYVFCFPGEL